MRAFGEEIELRRCIVPAVGFIEWTGAKEARRPVWYHAPDGSLLLFAGLYESWQDPSTGAWMRSFAILTTEPNDVVRPVHDRMPVILPKERIADWLYVPAGDPESYARDVRELLRPAANDALVATPVSARANSVKNDDEGCIAPANDREEAVAPRLL
jgi:putative SOS response-associated peptidase YedK